MWPTVIRIGITNYIRTYSHFRHTFKSSTKCLFNHSILQSNCHSYDNWTKLVHEYRDRVYIRKDILLKLYEYGELNQTKLLSYCGLNSVKHKDILDDMARKEMIIRTQEPWGNKTIIKYKLSEKGQDILKQILEPYESLFPRSEMEKT